MEELCNRRSLCKSRSSESSDTPLTWKPGRVVVQASSLAPAEAAAGVAAGVGRLAWDPVRDGGGLASIPSAYERPEALQAVQARAQTRPSLALRDSQRQEAQAAVLPGSGSGAAQALEEAPALSCFDSCVVRGLKTHPSARAAVRRWRGWSRSGGTRRRR